MRPRQPSLAVGLGDFWRLCSRGRASPHLTTFSNLELALQRQFEASRAEAGALLMSVAPLKVPDADNAAIIYGQAFQRLHSERRTRFPERISEYAFSPNQGWNFDAKDPGLRPFLRAHAATIALLHKAASKPGCYFQHDYYMPDVGFGMDFAELRGFGEAPALLLLDAGA